MATPTLHPFTVLTVVPPERIDALRAMEPSVSESREALRPLGWHLTWHVVINGSPGSTADLCALRCELHRLSKSASVPQAREFGMSHILGGWMMILDDGVLRPEGLAEVMASVDGAQTWAAAISTNGQGEQQDSWVAKHSVLRGIQWPVEDGEQRVRALLSEHRDTPEGALAGKSVEIKTCLSQKALTDETARVRVPS